MHLWAPITTSLLPSPVEGEHGVSRRMHETSQRGLRRPWRPWTGQAAENRGTRRSSCGPRAAPTWGREEACPIAERDGRLPPAGPEEPRRGAALVSAPARVACLLPSMYLTTTPNYHPVKASQSLWPPLPHSTFFCPLLAISPMNTLSSTVAQPIPAPARRSDPDRRSGSSYASASSSSSYASSSSARTPSPPSPGANAYQDVASSSYFKPRTPSPLSSPSFPSSPLSQRADRDGDDNDDDTYFSARHHTATPTSASSPESPVATSTPTTFQPIPRRRSHSPGPPSFPRSQPLRPMVAGLTLTSLNPPPKPSSSFSGVPINGRMKTGGSKSNVKLLVGRSMKTTFDLSLSARELSRAE